MADLSLEETLKKDGFELSQKEDFYEIKYNDITLGHVLKTKKISLVSISYIEKQFTNKSNDLIGKAFKKCLFERKIGLLFEILANWNPQNELLKTDNNLVNHPSHYNQNEVETIDIIYAYLTPKYVEPFASFCIGNIIKYLDRHKYKNGEQDLKKAQWYATKLIDTYMDDINPYDNFIVDLYNGDFTNAIKHWEEYRNELSKDL